jgi:hypothetical protein
MTERRFNDPRRGGSRYGGGRPDENAQPARPEPKRDPGAYIGRMPERSTGSAQGGFAPRDRRDNVPPPQTQTQAQPEPVAVNASVTPESPAAPRTAEPAAATPSKESSESTESRAGTEAPVAAATAAGTTATAPETGQGS